MRGARDSVASRCTAWRMRMRFEGAKVLADERTSGQARSATAFTLAGSSSPHSSLYVFHCHIYTVDA